MHTAIRAAGLAVGLAAVTCVLLYTGFRIADALDFHLYHFGNVR